jgi:hypothetical protein
MFERIFVIVIFICLMYYRMYMPCSSHVCKPDRDCICVFVVSSNFVLLVVDPSFSSCLTTFLFCLM